MLKLGAPVKGKKNGEVKRMLMITQLFGENLADFYVKLGLKGHNGIDFGVKHFWRGHAPVLAAHDGWVVSDASVQSDTKGRFVEIMSDEVEIDGYVCKIKTVYFHLKKCYVSCNLEGISSWWNKWYKKEKNYVKRGQLIGMSDNTGQYTTGAHLHFGMYIYYKTSNGYEKDYNNGFGGAVDPMPYFDCNEIMRNYNKPGHFWYKGQGKTLEEIKNLI